MSAGEPYAGQLTVLVLLACHAYCEPEAELQQLVQAQGVYFSKLGMCARSLLRVPLDGLVLGACTHAPLSWLSRCSAMTAA
jgi:hypothetical protein